MNKKQLVLLLAVAVIVLGAGLLVKRSRDRGWQAETTGSANLVLPDFPVNEVKRLEIAGADGAVTLVKKETGWCVEERFGYSADYAAINTFLRDLLDLSAAQDLQVGPSQYGRLNLLGPDEDGHAGTRVDFLGADGARLARLVLGKEHMRKSTGQQPPMMGLPSGGWPDGRYVRVPQTQGADRIALVSKTFSSIRPEGADWLDKEFFKTGKLVRASLASEGKTKWALKSPEPGQDMALTGLEEGREPDDSKIRSVASAFSYASFVDVADPKLAPAETGLDKPIVFTVQDEDGFVYTVSIGSKAPDGNTYLTVAVDLTLPETRQAAEGESDQDKAKKDAEFEKAKADKRAKLAALKQRLDGWVYRVPAYSVSAVLVERDDLIKVPVAEKPEAEAMDQP